MRSKTPELTKEKERHILDAAQKRFALYGIGKVTMDEIASDVGMGKASLYYYFPTKEDVFRQVVRREQDQFIGKMEELIGSELGPAEKLVQYQVLRLRLFDQLFTINQMSSQLWGELKPVLRDLYLLFEARELAFVSTILQEGKKSGTFHVTSIEKTASLLLHALHGLRLRMIGRAATPSVAAEHYRELELESGLLVDLFLSAIAKNKPSHALKGKKSHE